MAYLEKAPLNYNVSRARHEIDQHNNTSERPIHPLHSLQKLFHLISTTLHGLDEVPSKRPRAHTSTASHVQKPLENYSKHDNKNESASFDNHQQHYSCCCCCNELDRELYEYATSFDDVEQILCSSESHQETQSIASSQSIGSSSLKPNITLYAFSSSISLTNLQFKLIALDHEHGIELYSSPIANFPIYLMCGYAMMPCSSIDLLHYLSTEVRPQWDRYTRSCRVIRTIPAPLENNTEWRHRARQHQMSCALATSHTTLPQMHLHHNNDTNVSNETNTFCSNPTKQANAKWSSANRESHEILLQPGQRRVSVQHLCISSPVFMVQDREFELIVGEEVKKDGTTYIKAFSPPLGYAVPLDPLQRKYVRGIAYLTAAIAKPLLINSADQLPAGLRDAALSPSSVSSVHKTPKSVNKSVLQEQEEEEVNYSTRESTNVNETNTYSNHSFCLVGYVRLVHPMGLVPPVITNMVISAQLSSLRRLQEFILNNPLHKVVNDNIKSKTHENNSSKKYSWRDLVQDNTNDDADNDETKGNDGNGQRETQKINNNKSKKNNQHNSNDSKLTSKL